MDFGMKNLNQKIIKFNHDTNLSKDNFFISKSNKHIFDFLNKWPKWEKNFINIVGERFSGKTHLISIFLKKYNGLKIESKSLNEYHIKEIKLYENIILEDMDKKVDEKLFYTLFNTIEQDNKFLIITSNIPLTKIDFELPDLKSRSKTFILQNINKPDDELIFALLLKNFSDRQIFLEKKFIDFIIKRIDRSYGKIFDFIYKIDEMSLKKKKSIDFKTIKEVLGGITE